MDDWDNDVEPTFNIPVTGEALAVADFSGGVRTRFVRTTGKRTGWVYEYLTSRDADGVKVIYKGDIDECERLAAQGTARVPIAAPLKQAEAKPVNDGSGYKYWDDEVHG